MITAPEDLDHQLAAVGARGHRALVGAVIARGGHRCRGWSAAGRAPDGSTLFEIGSITKAFTGVLLADMVLRGEVSLEDPLSSHLPVPRPGWRHREPTLLELATHRSGLPNTPKGMNRRELAYTLGFGGADPWAALSEADYRRLLIEQSPRRAPGRKVRYSSMAVGLLGDALATRAGRPYEQLLDERVLGPLGMSATAVSVPPARADKLLVGHSRHGRPRPPIEDFMPAAGSLRSSADDMIRFLAACLQPPEGSLGAALSLAQIPHARMGKGLQLGLCWIILNRPDRPQVLWHTGGTWGFRSFAGLAPEHGIAAVVMSNTARSVDRLGLRLVEEGSQAVGQTARTTRWYWPSSRRPKVQVRYRRPRPGERCRRGSSYDGYAPRERRRVVPVVWFWISAAVGDERRWRGRREWVTSLVHIVNDEAGGGDRVESVGQ